MIGKRFGMLTVVEYVRSQNRNKVWRCVCDCGNEREVTTGKLNAGVIHACKACSYRLGREKIKVFNEWDIVGDIAFGKAANTGRVFCIDSSDYGKVKDLLWRECDNGYIISQLPGDKHILLHRLITGAKSGEVVDHKNHALYDNRKENLRVASQVENMMNATGRKNNTSGRKGVWQDKRNGRWVAEIKANKKKIYLGRYDTFEEAVKAREQGEEKYFGSWSYANSVSLSGAKEKK